MNNDKIGALWIKTTEKGTMMSGELDINGEKIKIVAFPNNYKEKESQPDYNILRAKTQEASAPTATDPTVANPWGN